mgnify:FL=1
MYDQVASHFENVKPLGPNKFICKCPCHNDTKQSLIVSIDHKDGKDWVNPYCFAGCDIKELRSLVREMGFNKFGGTTKPRIVKDPESGDIFVSRLPLKMAKEKRDELWKDWGFDKTYMYSYWQSDIDKPKTFSHFITRKDLPDGDKTFCIHTLWKDKDTKQYKWLKKGPPSNFKRPPYFMNLGRNPTTCFIHEGEKAVNACKKNYKEILHVTWQGGSNAVSKTDWSQLHNIGIEKFYLIPDNDEPGNKAMNEIATKLVDTEAEIFFVDTSTYPKRWDYADLDITNTNEVAVWMEKLDNAKLFGVPEEEPAEFIYINTMERFMHVEHKYFLSETGYKRKMTPILGHEGGAKEFFKNKNSIIVDKLTFDPTKKGGVTKEGSMSLWNIYFPPNNIQRIPGPVTLFLEHMEFLVPDELTRINVIKRMAHILQKPHIKIRSILLMFSEAEGVGKTTLFIILRHFLGKQYCKQINQRQIMGEFNEWAMDCLLIAIEEIAIKGDYGKRTSSMDILKTVISEDTVTVNIKNEKLFTIPNHINGFAFSNAPRPITLTKLSRRYHIVNVEALKKPPQYYDKLYTWLEKEGGYANLYDYLMSYDIADFNPNAEPPKTKAFFDLVESTQTPIDIELDNLYQSNSWPFTDKTCLVSPQHLKTALSKIKINASINQVCDWLRKNGFVSLEKQIDWINDQRPTIWCKGEVEKWKALSPKELRNYYLEPKQDQNEFYFLDASQMKRVNAIATLEALTGGM